MKRRSLDRPDARAYTRYAWFVLAVNLLVILWGAYVRASGSGAGCGAHWPLCNGVVVPQSPEIETLIELGHRVTSGLALVAVGLLGIWTLRRYRRYRPNAGALPGARSMRRLAWLAMFFIAGEAAIGAGIVLLKLVGENSSGARAAWMAGHLVNTFLLLATLALLAERSGRDPEAGPDLPKVRGSAWRAWRSWYAGAGLFALLATAATGAIAALGDTLFPAQSLAEGLAQDLQPGGHFLIQLRAFHPLVAVGTGLLWLHLAREVRKASQRGRFRDPRATRRTMYWSKWLTALVLLQFAVGLLTLGLLAPVPLQLLHLGMADLVWIAGVLLVDSGRRAALHFDPALRRRMQPPSPPPAHPLHP